VTIASVLEEVEFDFGSNLGEGGKFSTAGAARNRDREDVNGPPMARAVRPTPGPA
jgi:hypothetical protein